MNTRFDHEPEADRTPVRLIAASVLGVLVVGGGIGLVMNRTAAPATAAKSPAPRPALAASSVPVLPQQPSGLPVEPAMTPVASSTVVSIRSVQATPPPNPFEPVRSAAPLPVATPAAPKPAAAPAALAGAAPKLTARPQPAAGTPAAAPAPAAAQPAPANAPKPEELLLTGIIHGEPALAVMSFGGQSLFLKIGDQVADTWRLVEIKERSAIFQLGAQRVEVPIKGGSSE